MALRNSCQLTIFLFVPADICCPAAATAPRSNGDSSGGGGGSAAAAISLVWQMTAAAM